MHTPMMLAALLNVDERERKINKRRKESFIVILFNEQKIVTLQANRNLNE